MIAPDDEILMRWSDGELPAEEARRLEAAARTDADLDRRMAALRRLRTVAREAFPAEADSRDRDLARLIAATPAARALPLAGPRRWLAATLAPRRAAPWGALAAAAFVAGLLIGPNLSGDDGLQVAADGTLTDPGLVQVLDTRLASEGPDRDGRAIGLSFQDSERRWCRTFEAHDFGRAGLACREEEGWVVRVLAPLAPSAGEVRTAGSDIPEAVLIAVDGVIAGQSADAATEARARDAGWR